MINPNVDPRLLAVFLISVTQDGYVRELLPASGQPDYDNSDFTRLGLTRDIQVRFFTALQHKPEALQKFLDVIELFKTVAANEYHPPDCPMTSTLQALVSVVNGERNAFVDASQRLVP